MNTAQMAHDRRTVEMHRAELLELIRATPTEQVPLPDALGLASANEALARVPLPSFDNAAMDGYAVRAADVQWAPVTLPVTADLPAGVAATEPLAPGTAQRIMTGAQLPSGADAVVQVEFTDGRLTEVRIERPVKFGSAIRRAGEDIQIGDVLLHDGDEISAARIGLLAGSGIEAVTVHRRPVVSICVTGDELRQVGEELSAAAIYDSNSPMLDAAVRNAGAEIEGVWTLTDNVSAAHQQLAEAAERADLVITTGGISAGAYEVVKLALADNPAVSFHSVAVQPGKPQGLGLLGTTPVVALPGNPVSAFVSFILFALPAIRMLGGHSDVGPVHINARLTEAIPQDSAKRQYLLGVIEPEYGTVRLAGPKGSHRVGVLGRANCLVVVAEGDGEIDEGEQVRVILFK